MLTDVTAFAPATVANVGIGFDILGHTVEAVGDKVRLRRIDEPVVRIRSISWRSTVKWCRALRRPPAGSRRW